MLNSQQVTDGTSALQMPPDYREIERRYKRATDYLELDMTVIPIPNGQKHPNYAWGAFKGLKLFALYDDNERLTKRLRGQGRDMLWKFYGRYDGLAVVTGKPSDDLFVIDCDSFDSGEYVRKALAVRGIDAPYVETARGYHIYLKSRNGTIKSVATGTIADIEIKSNGDLVAAPPTIHPTGVAYRWANGFPFEIPLVDIQDIDFLQDKHDKTVQLQAIKTERYLHADTLDYIATGATLAEGTRNQRLFNAARDFQYIGKPVYEAERILAPIALASGLLRNDTIATIHSPYKKTKAKQSDSIQSRLWAYAKTLTFDGIKTDTGLAMIEALLQRRADDSHNRRNGIFRASYRELEAKAKVSHRTCQKALKCLISMGVIERAGNVDGKKRKACLWRFCDELLRLSAEYVKSNDYQKYHSSIYDTTPAVYCATFNSPLSERGALGKRGYQVYCLLSERDKMTVKDIAIELGISEGSVRYQLTKLKKAKLVAHDSPYYRILDNQVALYRATLDGVMQDGKRRQRIMADRALYQLKKIVTYIEFMKPVSPSKTTQLANYSASQASILHAPKQPIPADTSAADTYISSTHDLHEIEPIAPDMEALEVMYRDAYQEADDYLKEANQSQDNDHDN